MKSSVFVYLLFLNLSIYAQLISVKSIPVATGDQFLIFPSKNLSMAGVNIGIEDKWFDVFNNPANESLENNIDIFVLPTFYNTSGNLGGAYTTPITVFLKNNDWFGTASFALQNHKGASITSNTWGRNPRNIRTNRNNSNVYGRVSLGTVLTASNWRVGLSLFISSLNAVGGVDLLYNNSSSIEQEGSIYEFRGGMYYKNKTTVFEAVALYNIFNMKHTVEYSWPPITSSFIRPTEINKDKTNTWGLHLKYREKPNDKNMTIGAVATFNYKNHPKIPNYEIMNIPRDPGNSWCFNFGLGIGVKKETTKLGIDLIYEPIWSNTWVATDELIIIENGPSILPGQKTIENDFVFNNIIARIGYSTQIQMLNLSGGLEIYNRSYSLAQENFIDQSLRNQEEDWAEYTWSWGAELNFTYFDLKYTGHIITGAGIPAISNSRTFNDDMRELFNADFVTAPSRGLILDYKTTSMHQFIIHIPIPYS